MCNPPKRKSAYRIDPAHAFSNFKYYFDLCRHRLFYSDCKIESIFLLTCS